jgi:hypothetical protein
MGLPIKLTIGGEAVFLCCAGCQGQATSSPDRTLARAKELRSELREGAAK